MARGIKAASDLGALFGSTFWMFLSSSLLMTSSNSAEENFEGLGSLMHSMAVMRRALRFRRRSIKVVVWDRLTHLVCSLMTAIVV